MSYCEKTSDEIQIKIYSQMLDLSDSLNTHVGSLIYNHSFSSFHKHKLYLYKEKPMLAVFANIKKQIYQ
ncbi:hypothetical protein BpHYR1_047565 [Brachionus plicatilis]|uniref:Uncharacterized protein n=1 Tax=Brachionus plicatilis TaxID=10195 RepID=A0A3M7SS84_BRAPC|nr:hypothetical protein BpHYR1_047565 [Brachionus plicatilis]